MKYKISTFHGSLPSNLVKRLDELSCYKQDEHLIYEGSIDNFLQKWKRHVMIYPDTTNLAFDGTIFVTQYKTFSQR